MFLVAEMIHGILLLGSDIYTRCDRCSDMYVQTGKGALYLVEVQLQGKKRMDTGSFLRGCHVEEGSFFTL